MATSTNSSWFSSGYMAVIIPCTLFRFALFVPLGNYSLCSKTHWDVIKDHVELHSGLYDPAIIAGENIAKTWGKHVYYWNIAVWVLSFWFPPPLNFVFLVVDAVMAVQISRATGYQTGYVPHSKASCVGAAYSWHRPAGANESFFEAAGRLNSTVATPIAMCRSFVEEWQYGITGSFFYALITLLNIVAFFAAVSNARKEGESRRKTFVSLFRGVILNFPKVLFYFMYIILWILPESIFRCLPISFKSKVRHGRRYALKTGLALEQEAELGVTELKDVYKRVQGKRAPRYQGGAGEVSPLSDFLGIYDMLFAVAEEMHYSDIMNLSRVSKSVREAVLPTNDINRRVNVFKQYTCQSGLKKNCYTCDKQICTSCGYTKLLPQGMLTHHLQYCHPYCNPCYRKWVVTCRPRLHRQRTKAPDCKCAPRSTKPNFILRLLKGTAYYACKTEDINRALCRDCNSNSPDELITMKEKKSKLDLKRGLQWDGTRWTKCYKCDDSLGLGPRWWVCGKATCGKECRSIAHKGFGRKEKHDGAIVGEEV